MSKCGICGNEILTGDIHWAIGICNNCYNKLYKSDEQKYVDMLHKENSELLVNSLAEKDKQIAELQKQLEEKEKDNQFLKKMYLSERTKNDNYHTEKYALDKPVEELRKIKLTPKEKEIYYKGFDNCERQFATHIAELQQQLHSQPAEIVEKINGEIYTRMVVECKETKYTDINLILDTILKNIKSKRRNKMQLSLFGGTTSFKIDKPIRLIELFGGISCQAQALLNLDVDFENYRYCDFDKYACQSHNEIMGTNDKPSDITKWKGEDLGICDIDKYCYIMTYSFPCTDLSTAGKMAGMERNSGTRSGLLWEVERLLKECNELPQVLLMENVPQVHGNKNKVSFYEWCQFLESLGYKNYWKDLNAKDYGVPQSRNRCFMVSLLGDYSYEFPKPVELNLKLQDLLEDEVDEKYYISDKMVNYISANKWLGNNGNNFCMNRECACTKTTREWQTRADTSDYICENLPVNYKLKTQMCNKLIQEGKVKENDVIRHSYSTSRMNGEMKDIQQNNMCPTLDTRCDCLGLCKNYRIRKLTPTECLRLMGVRDEYSKRMTCSNAQKYKQAGNGIVVDVLMAIFKQML